MGSSIEKKMNLAASSSRRKRKKGGLKTAGGGDLCVTLLGIIEFQATAVSHGTYIHGGKC